MDDIIHLSVSNAHYVSHFQNYRLQNRRILEMLRHHRSLKIPKLRFVYTSVNQNIA